MPFAAFDTNIFFYATGLGEIQADREKVGRAIALLSDVMAEELLVVPVQVCLEFHHVLLKKGRVSENEAAAIVAEYTDGALIIPTDLELARMAFDLVDQHKLQTYDAAILAAAARARCEILFSEDMQDGFEWNGVRIVNPFV